MNYSKPSSSFSSRFFELTKQSKQIFITAHMSPDDDSIASALSIYALLIEKWPKKKIEIVYTGKSIDTFQTFKNFNKIKFVSDIADVVTKKSLLIACDGSQYERFTFQPEKLKKLADKTICIDHHSSPIDKFDLSLVNSSASSCAELVYLSFHKNKKISKSLAEIYLLGILGDTGNFTYLKPHQTETLTIAKKLLEIGNTEIQEFQSRYHALSIKVFTLIQELIKNTQYHKIDGWPNFQTSFIDRKFIKTGNCSGNEVSKATHIYVSQYLRMIQDHPWGFVATPRNNRGCEVSLRSLPNSVNVRDVMEKMGIGGGHDRAAGGTFKKEKEVIEAANCLNMIIKWMKKNKPVIV